jgi:hypothetical protein
LDPSFPGNHDTFVFQVLLHTEIKMPLARLVKDVEVTFGATLLSSEFMSQFYTVFFTLSPESEKRFGDIEKQKKVN